MNPQQVAVAIWKAIEAAGGTPRTEIVAVTLRKCFKARFRDADLIAWLRPFKEDRRMPADSGRTKPLTGADSGRIPADASRAGDKVSLFSKPVDSLRSSTRVAVAPHEAGTGKAPRATRLPFDRELLDRRTAILKAVWTLVQPTIGGVTTFTRWRARNSTVAASLAKAGVPPNVIVAAWNQVSTRLGEPVRELRLVESEIEGAMARAAARREAHG